MDGGVVGSINQDPFLRDSENNNNRMTLESTVLLPEDSQDPNAQPPTLQLMEDYYAMTWCAF